MSLAALLPRLLQTVCLCCGRWVRADSRLAALCEDCLQALPWITDACEKCALPVHRCSGLLPACSGLPFSAALAPLRYAGFPARWVIRAKRQGGFPEARLLGMLLALAVQESVALAAAEDAGRRPDLLIPVPLSWQRQLLRGHNQAQLLSQALAAALSLKIDARSVYRRTHTAIQPGLDPAERRANVAGAFACRRRFNGDYVVVVDDVLTSAATTAEVARCLLDAGCARVDVWCATRAEPS